MTRIGRSVRQVYKGIHQKARASFSCNSSQKLISKAPTSLTTTMKCFITIVLLALFAMAFAEEKPAEPEKFGPVPVAPQEVPRDKRGVVLSYSSPLAYTAYSTPIYSSSYNLPYAYRSYPYYSYYW
ncbi:uncharacterized protein LOC143181684 [Calliopsis andreniformis]|uniref:uncharacterized protein LOC143181684 n=1 Tax=Calliopsis andreniformis TaxID=337506 RepID=UPI003FCE6ACF